MEVVYISIVDLRVMPYPTDINEAEALSAHKNLIDIYSCSWGPEGGVRGPRTATKTKLEDGAKFVCLRWWLQFAHELFISNTYCCWAESLLLAQISMMYYGPAPRIMSSSEKLGFIGKAVAGQAIRWVGSLCTKSGPYCIYPSKTCSDPLLYQDQYLFNTYTIIDQAD